MTVLIKPVNFRSLDYKLLTPSPTFLPLLLRGDVLMPGDITDSLRKQNSETSNVGEIKQLFNGPKRGEVFFKGQYSVQ